MLRYWRTHRVLEKSVAQRQGRPDFTYYEEPAFAYMIPGAQDVLVRIYQDMYLRYKAMRGYHVLRRSGWNSHGLPVEVEVEKRLGFSGKSQIESYGIERFNDACRNAAIYYVEDWEKLANRVASWTNYQNSYVTGTKEYIESVWWILKTLWEKGLLYQGVSVLPCCPRCGTPLSSQEVARGHQEAANLAVYVRLPLAEGPGTSLLVWTARPWTLPGNVAVAVHPEGDYTTVERQLPEGGSEQLVLASHLVEAFFKGESIQHIETIKGRKMKGWRYLPLFTFLLPEQPAYQIVLDDSVDPQKGSGLVNVAPAFSSQAMRLCQEHDLPLLQTVTEQGTFIPEVRPWSGKFVRDVDPLIVRDLESRGLLFQAMTYPSNDPFCVYCETPLVHYARGAWLLRTEMSREKLLELNRAVTWYQEESAADFVGWRENRDAWLVGRDRYWGTPLPVWECLECHHQVCVGSIAELSQRSGEDQTGLDLHRPHVDRVVLDCPECGGQMRRLPEVLDAWFEAACMPAAQWHYPYENQELFQSQHPADLVCVEEGRRRAWLYPMLATTSLLFESQGCRNAVFVGTVLDRDGRKPEKPAGKVLDPWEAINNHGADALRWDFYVQGPQERPKRFAVERVKAEVRGFTLPLWNVYVFFVRHANLANWRPETPGNHPTLKASNILDRWLISELQVLVRDVTTTLETYDALATTRSIQAFVGKLSRWYLRCSRVRFKHGWEELDQKGAFTILYETLVMLCKLLAPAMPCLADELYQNLVCSIDKEASISVHLTDWPLFDSARLDEDLNREMALVMDLAALGRSARGRAGIRLRQPLSEIAFWVQGIEGRQVVEKFADLLGEVLNVKRVRLLEAEGEAASFRLNPIPGRLGSKHKALYPEVCAALTELDTEGAARALLDGHALVVNVQGKAVKVLPDEVEVHLELAPGTVSVGKEAHLAVLQTDLTPELAQEGLARAVVHLVQGLRKQAGLEYNERVYLYVEAAPAVLKAVQVWEKTVMQATGAATIKGVSVPKDGVSTEAVIGKDWVRVGITRIEK